MEPYYFRVGGADFVATFHDDQPEGVIVCVYRNSRLIDSFSCIEAEAYILARGCAMNYLIVSSEG